MPIASLVEIVHSHSDSNWSEKNKESFLELFGAQKGRYPNAAEKTFTVRAPIMRDESSVPFSAYIHPQNPPSGAYGGFSFVMFPADGAPCLIGLGVGTQGLSPDESILGRPGHSRKAQAICSWLNSKHGNGQQIAWAKHDPTRTDLSLPRELEHKWPEYKHVFKRYGQVMYLLFKPTQEKDATREALTALLDLCFEERGYSPLAAFKSESENLRSQWFAHLMPRLLRAELKGLLEDHRFVIVQGPPGTGKTTMALELLAADYDGHGQSIQFHPNTTYESFIGGMAPVQTSGELGLRFSPEPGFLMKAVADADKEPNKPFLLHIDEINRADLSKVLGEAIFLFEPQSAIRRAVSLQYVFPPPINNTLRLPSNLHVLGTMNTADRSIAIVDVAVRRRFAFATLWPQIMVVHNHGSSTMQEAFRNLIAIFVEHASEDAFNLLPGHSYFLELDESKARRKLKTSLLPLLQEYLAQGYVTAFSEPVRNYIQWVNSL